MWKSRWLSALVFLLCLAPLLWLIWRWQTNQLGINSIEFVSRYLGRWTLRLLLITLAITPLRRLPHLSPLIRFRRMVGLFTFFYGCLHGWHYFARDAQWHMEIIVEDLTYRRFFIAGALALLLMAPLAVTSFDAAVRWMGGKRWQRLHRLIYVSAASGVVHYAWQGKGITATPVFYGAILVLLLAIRVGLAIQRRGRLARARIPAMQERIREADQREGLPHRRA
jgi:sulfoxide reductase heme-binding subunit YedZ